ncbi:uncharacterized protein [Ranitomeya imitator]|uniref:uncharacterized protein n=1 Tax=Ranitomeya imitator TaxID=111125 RepID=UPI0037E8FE05
MGIICVSVLYRQTVRFLLYRMDFKAREKTWQAKASDLFKQGPTKTNEDVVTINKDLIKQYRSALYKKTKTWWNRSALENYMDKQIIPRGLRVQLYPSFELEDDVLIKRWLSTATTCSLEFIQIIIDKNTMSLASLDSEIDECEQRLMKDIPVENFDQVMTEINKDVDRWEKEVCQNKIRKFQRDVNDYDTDKIYRWQNKKATHPGRNKQNDRRTGKSSHQRSPSASSAISTSDINTSQSDGENVTSETSKNEKRLPDIFTRSKALRTQGDQLKVINLSKYELSMAEVRLLERGLTFSPTCRLDTFTAIRDLHLFSRKLILKKFHFKNDAHDNFSTVEEDETLRNLEELLEENAPVQIHIPARRTFRFIVWYLLPLFPSPCGVTTGNFKIPGIPDDLQGIAKKTDFNQRLS